MHAESSRRWWRILTILIPILALSGCGEGDGPASIRNMAIPPLDPLPAGFCDPINFEEVCPNRIASLEEFEGGPITILANPQVDANNDSAVVARLQKFQAASGATFGGGRLNLTTPFVVVAGSSFTMNVWSPRPVPVQFQAGIATVDVNHGGTGWEVLTFDLGNASGNVDSIAIIFDNGTNGNAGVDPARWTFYFDDITLVLPRGAGVSIDPDVTLYYPNPAGDPPDLVIPDDYDEITVFGSESVYNLFYADDDTYGEVLAVSSGTGYNANVAQVGFIGFDPGFVTFYESLEFKVKGMPNLVIFVSLYEGGERVRINLSSSGFASGLGNGWYQVSIPISRFTGLTTATGIVFESDDTAAMQFTFFLNDIGFSGGDDDGGGNTGGGDIVLATFDEATPPAITEFGGAIATIAAGPAGGDGNALKIDRNNGGPNGLVFAGAWVAIPPIPSDAGDQTVSVRVYSPTAGIRMVAKAEYGDQLGSGDTEANEAVVVGWQTLTWTFTNLDPNESYNRFVLLPNLDNVDDLDYYFDDITVVGTGGGGNTGGGDTVLATFDEATPPAITEFGGAIATIAAGPAGGDGNALKIDRNNGGPNGLVFAGAWVAIPPIPSDAGDQTVSVRVYSPTAGIRMVAKAEYGDQLGSGDTEANEAVVVGWQTLTWTFTNLDPNESYNRFVLLPNLDNVDDLDYYFDDITVLGTSGGGGGGGGGSVAGDIVPDGGFEAAGTGGLQEPWFVFENGGTVTVSNANSNGGTYAARLQADASSGTASFPILKVERLAAGSLSGGESVTVSFDVIDVDAAGTGKTFVAELFTERTDPPGGATNEVILGGYDLTGTWASRSFTTTLGADAAGGVSLLFKADCGGNTACTMDVFIDNVSIVIN